MESTSVNIYKDVQQITFSGYLLSFGQEEITLYFKLNCALKRQGFQTAYKLYLWHMDVQVKTILRACDFAWRIHAELKALGAR